MDKKHDKDSNLKKAWAAPTWAYVGDVEDVIQQLLADRVIADLQHVHPDPDSTIDAAQ